MATSLSWETTETNKADATPTLPDVDTFLKISTTEKILETLIVCILDFLSLAGNTCLWVVILGTPALRTISNFLVLEMSASCILISLINLPATGYSVAAGLLRFPEEACVFLAFTVITIFVFSFSILALISFNRYVLVCHPRSYSKVFNKTSSVVMMIGVVIFSALVALPPIIGWGKFSYFSLQSTCLFEWGASVPYFLFLIIICVVGPISVMVICYLKIILTVKYSNRKIHAFYPQQSVAVVMSKGNPPITVSTKDGKTIVDHNTNCRSEPGKPEENPHPKQSLRDKEELRLTMSFLIVIGAFFFSVLPNCTVALSFLSPYSRLPRGYAMLAILMVYSYCFTTPILYMKLNKKYMEAFTRIFIKQTWRKKGAQPFSSEG